jgi:hypothetical protein
MRKLVWVSLILAGCSTAPVANTLDLLFPSRLGSGPARGGVCQPNPPLTAPPAGLPPGRIAAPPGDEPPPPDVPAVPR